jgi:hypothetical protein
MNIPGFLAERSLSRTFGGFRTGALNAPTQAGVVPAGVPAGYWCTPDYSTCICTAGDDCNFCKLNPFACGDPGKHCRCNPIFCICT